jgi:drug/metabolite transporter, DME family|tara:strand:- start:1144 stop:2019 length:876 start_codon:yes stop_codon:yes gene_type:complete
MNIIKKIPGPVLVFIGAVCLSFGGVIVKSFEGANLWQILFWRQFFFAIIVILYLLITYKKKFFKSFYISGLPGFLGGLSLSLGFAAYVYAMYTTTVANTNFIITTETIFLATLGYFFLKEKIDIITLISIILGMTGVLIILGSSLSIQSSEQFMGNIIAFIMPISFAVLVVVVRMYPKVDMVPAQFTAGIIAAIIGFVFAGKILISPHDLFLAFLAGFFQIGFGFILITLGSQTTPAAIVGVLMLTESVFGPLLAWLFINEIPPYTVLVGGGIIIFSILFQSFFGKKNFKL